MAAVGRISSSAVPVPAQTSQPSPLDDRVAVIRALSLKTPVVRKCGDSRDPTHILGHHSLSISHGQAAIKDLYTEKSRSLHIGDRIIWSSRLLSPDRFFTHEFNRVANLSTVTVWEMGKQDPVWTHTSPVPITGRTQILTKGHYFCRIDGDLVVIYDLEKQRTHAFARKDFENLIGFSPDRIYASKPIVKHGEDIEYSLGIYCLDTEGNQIWESSLSVDGFPYETYVLGSHEKTVVIASAHTKGTRICLFDKDNGTCQAYFEESDQVRGQVYGEYLAIWKSDTVDIWHLPSHKLITTIKPHRFNPRSISGLTIAPEKITVTYKSGRLVEYTSSQPDNRHAIARMQASLPRQMYVHFWDKPVESIQNCWRAAKGIAFSSLGACLRKKKRE